MSTLLTVHHPDFEDFNLDGDALAHFADALLQETGHAEYGLSLVLTDDQEVHHLNKTYRHKDKATNVLSFPFTDGAEAFLGTLPVHELGDIIISLDTARRESEEYAQPFSRRMCWLTVHGLLHLLGMDHERSSEEAQQMFAREEELQKIITPAEFGL
jgi:rRNA maturation RNase YbeY